MKKRSIGLLVLLTLLVVAPLTACGGGNNGKEDTKPQTKKIDKKEADVVSERTEVVDGQEVTIKTFEDGSEIPVPKGVSLDDADVVQADMGK